MLSALRGSLLPFIRTETLRVRIGIGDAQRGLCTLGHIRTVRRSAERLPKDCVDGKAENFAPSECLVTGTANMKAAERFGDLKAVVEPIAHREVAHLAGQDHFSADPLRRGSSRQSQRMKNFRRRIANFSFGNDGNVVSRDVEAVYPAERFDLADEWLIERVFPNITEACKARCLHAAATRQLICH